VGKKEKKRPFHCFQEQNKRRRYGASQGTIQAIEIHNL
jgi:hypothetical protein